MSTEEVLRHIQAAISLLYTMSIVILVIRTIAHMYMMKMVLGIVKRLSLITHILLMDEKKLTGSGRMESGLILAPVRLSGYGRIHILY